VKRLRDLARERGKLVDATQGRKTRSVIVTDSDHVVLSAIQPATISERLSAHDPTDPIGVADGLEGGEA
jgi:regulator of extracellular matrix RemA (YlzA/DUF370 family)